MNLWYPDCAKSTHTDKPMNALASPSVSFESENLDCFFDSADLRNHGYDAESHGAPRPYVLYCETKANAMDSRLAGNIAEACELESLCESIYKNIPRGWRW